MFTVGKPKHLALADLSPLRALETELPDSTMAIIRSAWPEIQTALRRGHALKTIQQRLSDSGIEVSYRVLCVYVSRLRREKDPSLRTTIPAARSDPRRASVPDDVHSSDPFAAAMAALNKPRYDIRLEMADGDPTKRNLI